MAKNENLKLTSVKIHKDLLERSKIDFVRTKFTLQKLVNRAIDLYNKDIDFRNKIHLHTDLVPSSSL
jgi:hypothetical protein